MSLVAGPTIETPGAAGRRCGRAPHRATALFRQPLLLLGLRRLFLAVPLLFVVTVLSFVLVSITPGDAAAEILGLNAPPGAYEKLRTSLGLDLPLHEQYWNWLRDALRGDLGASLFSEEKVTHAINTRLPVTLSLMVGALLVSLVLGVGLGVVSAVRGGALGRAIDALSMVGLALPSFWLAAVFISFFAVKLGWFPAVGYVPFSDSPAAWLRSLALPVASLALPGMAAIAKQTREAMLDVLGSEYVRAARENGVAEPSILFRHALKNAAIVVVTILGLQAVGLLGGTVLVEYVFALPGLGSLAVNASIQHDLPMVQGIVVYFTVIVVVINLAIDLLYTWLNPKVRTS